MRLCHPNHQASIHVLEKCGFVLEDLLAGFTDFPNLGSGQHEDCLRYVTRCRMLIVKDHELADQTNKTDRKPGNLNPFAVSTMKGANPPSAWDQLKDH